MRWLGAAGPILAARAALVTLTAALALQTASAQYSYDFDLYNTYVSHTPWRTYASMTNSTWSPMKWSVTYDFRTCWEVSGNVTLALQAEIVARRSGCTGSSSTMTETIEPMSSLAIITRSVILYDYYSIRKLDYRGSVVASGYATVTERFNDYAMAPYN